jgi:hypothetical protein
VGVWSLLIYNISYVSALLLYKIAAVVVLQVGQKLLLIVIGFVSALFSVVLQVSCDCCAAGVL